MKSGPSSRNRLWRSPLVRVILSLSVLGILFTVLPVSDLWKTMRQVPVWLWGLAILSLISGHVVGAMKWRLLLSTSSRTFPVRDALRCYFAGLFANLFLPSMTGGDIVRAGLAIRAHHEKEAVIVGSITDRMLDTSALVLIVLSGSALLPAVVSAGVYRVVVPIVVVMTCSVLLGVVLVVAPTPGKMPKAVENGAQRCRRVLEEFIKNPRRIVTALGAAILMQLWFIALSYVLASKIGISLSFAAWLIIWPLSKLSAMLPISIGGLGVREVALAGLLSPFRVVAASAVALGLLWESLIIALGGFGGVFYLISANDPSRSNMIGRKRRPGNDARIHPCHDGIERAL